jgi:glutamate synthase domain-containing protein 2
MSYGSISYNAHESIVRAAKELGTYYNTGEGGLLPTFTAIRTTPLFR